MLNGLFLIEADVLIGIPHASQITFEVFAADDYSATAVVGVERKGFGMPEVVVKEKMHMMVGIVDKSERRHTAGFESQILHHALRRSKGKLAARRESARHKRGLEASLKVVDGKVVVAVEAYEIVLVAFVVAEKQVLAVHRTVVLPPFFRFFNGFSLGMVVAFERYVVVA